MESGSVEEKKLAQERLRENNRVRRIMESKSLSTITEEPKSRRSSTAGSRSTYTKQTIGQESVFSDGDYHYEEINPPFTLPPLLKPITPREKRHTSVVLKATSRELIVPHVPTSQRSPSVQEDILLQVTTAKQPLFPVVLNEETSPTAPSILVTGFGLRNLASLQEALQLEEHIKLQQLYRAQATPDNFSDSSDSTDSKPSRGSRLSAILHISKSDSIETQTDFNTTTISAESQQTKLSYLMGLSCGEEEGSRTHIKDISPDGGDDDHAASTTTEAMRKAQKYLRIHKIFEFIQFIITHLLSAIPEDPIEFILHLLDKCLIYRSGFVEPPVLYGRKHLEALFNLMDRMRSGYISCEQYKTGMKTLGICSFNEKPHATTDGLIGKEDFIEEAHESLTRLLDDMIRRHWINTHPPVVPPPPPTPQFSSTSQTCCSAECMAFANSGAFLDCAFHT